MSACTDSRRRLAQHHRSCGTEAMLSAQKSLMHSLAASPLQSTLFRRPGGPLWQPGAPAPRSRSDSSASRTLSCPHRRCTSCEPCLLACESSSVSQAYSRRTTTRTMGTASSSCRIGGDSESTSAKSGQGTQTPDTEEEDVYTAAGYESIPDAEEDDGCYSYVDRKNANLESVSFASKGIQMHRRCQSRLAVLLDPIEQEYAHPCKLIGPSALCLLSATKRKPRTDETL